MLVTALLNLAASLIHSTVMSGASAPPALGAAGTFGGTGDVEVKPRAKLPERALLLRLLRPSPATN